ncbi:MAG: hypothetical protein WC100_16240 [Sterolibacterium sp.]
MKLNRYATPAILAALILSISGCAGPGPKATVEVAPPATAAVETVSVDAAAQLAAGNAAYSRGDYAEAFKLYRELALRGVAAAQYRLAILYASGQGTRRSPSQARHWMDTAAHGNYPGAVEALALIHAMTAKG